MASALPLSKPTKLTNLIRSQASSFGFSTFPAGEIDISDENYRPQKEGSGVASRKAGGANWPMSLAERLADNELARLMKLAAQRKSSAWLTLRSTSPA